jgi:putative copper export protein
MCSHVCAPDKVVGVISPDLDTVRLFLHVLGASVWVGGQIVLAGLVPALRRAVPASTKVAARAFNRVAWPAFVVLVVTGIWNVLAIEFTSLDTDYQVTAFVHIALAALTGVSAAVHSIGQTRIALAVGGAVGGLSAIGALFVGILLAGG